MTIIEMRVHMDCAGCESKEKSALKKLKGVDNMSMQKVTVTGYAEQKKVLITMRKTGGRAELRQLPYSADFQKEVYYQQHHCNGAVNYFAPQPTSDYNYYKHGYDSSNLRYHHYPSQSSIFGHQTGAAFSHDNPHACSTM